MSDVTLPSDQNTRPDAKTGPSSLQAAGEAASTVAQSAAHESQAVVGEAKTAARDLAGEARTQLRSQAGDQAERLAGTLRSFGEQLSSMAGAPEAHGTAAELARQAATRTRGVADRIESGGLDGVVDDVKRFARQRPGAFLLGAAGAGLVVGRLLKNVDSHALAQAAKSGDDDAHGPAAAQELRATSPRSAGRSSSPGEWDGIGTGDSGGSAARLAEPGSAARTATGVGAQAMAAPVGETTSPSSAIGITGLAADRPLGGPAAGVS